MAATKVRANHQYDVLFAPPDVAYRALVLVKPNKVGIAKIRWLAGPLNGREARVAVANFRGMRG